MRNNTPPSSPFFEREDVDDGMDGENEDDELIYIGDAEEVLQQLEAEQSDEEDEGGAQVPEDEYGPPQDDSVLTFSAHEGPVFCGSFHPTEKLAVTGGEDDKGTYRLTHFYSFQLTLNYFFEAYVWSTETGNVVFAVTGHKDSVIAAEFSADGNFLAVGDMAGFIEVFKPSQEYKKVWEFEMGDMSWMRWHIAANVLIGSFNFILDFNVVNLIFNYFPLLFYFL